MNNQVGNTGSGEPLVLQLNDIGWVVKGSNFSKLIRSQIKIYI
jgi:hypothetical protein